MSLIFVKPIPGQFLRDPITKVKIKTEGQLVEKNSFWLRRIKFGDVTIKEGKAPLLEKVEEIKESKGFTTSTAK